MNTQFKKQDLLHRMFKTRAGIFLTIIIVAFVAFELFNFSTTEYAFRSILGNADKTWPFILAVAFCGMDFAGLARLFTPEQKEDEPVEVWYLFGAWILAAAMNATLTWWGVAVAMQGTTIPEFASGSEKVIPVFVAVLVWLIRVLLVGTFASRGDAMFNAVKPTQSIRPQQLQTPNRPTQSPASYRPQTQVMQGKPQNQKPPQLGQKGYTPPQRPTQPTYHNLFRDEDEK